MNAHSASVQKIEILPGELVQILGAKRIKCQTQRANTHKRKTLTGICRANNLTASKAWPIMADDTVASLLERWLADVPVRSFKKVAQVLGLNSNLDDSVLKLNKDTRLRLNTLRAMLSGVEILEFMSPSDIDDFTSFLKGARNLVTDGLSAGDYDPAFVVYGAEELPGITFMADRVLKVDTHGWREVELEF